MRKPLILLSNVAAYVMVMGMVMGMLYPASSAVAADSLQNVERKLETKNAESLRLKATADHLKTEIKVINVDLVAAASRVHDQERQVADIETELDQLEREAKVKTGKLNERRQQFSGVMMALARISRFPTEALIALPIPPEDIVRSTILLRAAIPTLEQRAGALKTSLTALSTARTKVETRRADLETALDRLREDAEQINVIRKRKAALRAEAISKGRVVKSQARQLAKQAKNIRELMNNLAIQQKAEAKEAKRVAAKKAAMQEAAIQKAAINKTAPTSQRAEKTLSPLSGREQIVLRQLKSMGKARGKLPFPAVGRLVGGYGQALKGGLTRKGLSIETRAGGQVVSPFDGKVVFSGPFRGYGQLLIIDHGEGYHSLLAGLGRIDAQMQQSVLAGEPVAIMDNHDNKDGGGPPILYVEFRRNNEPINPLPWLVARKGTPKG